MKLIINTLSKHLFLISFILVTVSCNLEHSNPESNSPSLFYKIEGQGKPALVMLHGMLGSHHYWDGVVPSLAANHELILIDLLGFGESPKPILEYTVKQHVAEIEKAIELAHQEKIVAVIVGHSMGSFLALNYAIAHPEKTEKLILINPPMRTDEQSLKMAIADSSSQLMVTMTFNKTWGMLVCKVHEFFPAISYPLIRIFESQLPPAVAKAAGQHTYNSYRGSFENVLLKQNFYELLELVQNIPVLILASTQDQYTKDLALEDLPKRSNLKLVVIDGNHNVLLSHPKRISSEILKFIK